MLLTVLALVNCEIHQCSVCEKRLHLLKDMKTHITSEHEASKQLVLLKMDRFNPIIVDFKKIQDQ